MATGKKKAGSGLTDPMKALGALDVDSFKAIGIELGEILRDFRDPSFDTALQQRINTLGDRLEAGNASMEIMFLFMGYVQGMSRPPANNQD